MYTHDHIGSPFKRMPCCNHLGSNSLLTLAIMKRSLSSSSSAAHAAISDVRLSTVHAHGHQTKSTTVQTLMNLQGAGLLEGEETERTLRRKLRVAVESHSNVETPYGPMVQQILIGASKLAEWEVCNPCAWLWYMSSISTSFCTVMRDCVARTAGIPLRLVIYADEVIPRNPFRPDKGRN